MGVQVEFSYDTWLAQFPEFAEDVNEAQALVFFNTATLYHRNDGGGRVEDPTSQLLLLNMMTAHIAQLFRVANGHAVSELVGHIDSATQGSVTVAASLDVGDGPSQWLAQTKYGYAYWAATAPYRNFAYAPGPRRYFGSVYPGGIFGRSF
jgi:hypothetical protein